MRQPPDPMEDLFAIIFLFALFIGMALMFMGVYAFRIWMGDVI